MCTEDTGYKTLVITIMLPGYCSGVMDPRLTFDLRSSEINFMQEKLALSKFEVKHEEQCRSF